MLLDLGLGIFIGIMVSSLSGILSWTLILISVAFALLPDLDFIIYKVFGIHQDKGYKHRELFHYPLLYLPLGSFLIFHFFGRYLAIAFFLASFLHFVHDSIAYGRGVKWLFPFSKDGYAFIYLFSRAVKRGLWQPVFIFNEETTAEFDREHGDEEWLTHIYKEWHPIAIIEFSFFLLSLICLFFYVR